MQIQQIDTDIVLFIGPTYESLATAFIDGDRVLLVDALASEADAELMRQHIEETLGKRVTTIVLTHCHTDHMAGVRLFPEAEILAQRLFMYTFMERRDRPRSEYRDFVQPTSVIDQQLTIPWGRHTLNVFHNPGKTVCTLNIDVPSADMLFVGDHIVARTAYVGASTPEVIDDAIARLCELPRRSRVVPGHVGIQPWSALEDARHYLATLTERVWAYRTSMPAPWDDAEIDAIDIEACMAPGLIPNDFERYWHRQNLLRIVDRHLVAFPFTRGSRPVRRA